MKKQNLLLKAFCMLGFAAALFSCSNYDAYTIGAPDWLKSKVDSIAKAQNPQRGDTTNIDIANVNVGPDDCSAGWWVHFSDYFTIPPGRLLHLEFENYTSGANNWNNWNVCVCEGKREVAETYSEHFVLRSDLYGWGNDKYQSALIKSDYPEKLDDGVDMWAVFREKMQGAYVEMDIDHSKAGYVFVTAKHTAKDGTEFTETYEQPVPSTADVNAFLICDGSHFKMKHAYTISSKKAEVQDQNAIGISIEGYPEVLPLGTIAKPTDVLGAAEVTVIWEDGSTSVVNNEDVSLNTPDDMTTPGKKTIIYSYSKTKQGNYGKPVAGTYQLSLVLPVRELQVTAQPVQQTYWFYGEGMPAISTAGLEVTTTYTDGTTGVMPAYNLGFSELQPKAGKQAVTVSYEDATMGIVTTTFDVNVKKGYAKVGAYDFTNGWWTTFSEPDVEIPAGETYSFSMMVYSDNLSNWHSPCTILRGAALNEYAVVRMDHYGWGDGYGTAVLESNWDFDTFSSNINGSEVTVSITNNGNNTADIRYDVTYANGEKHFQTYKGITVNSADLFMAFVTEESCLIFHD